VPLQMFLQSWLKKGLDMSLVKHSLGDDPTRSSLASGASDHSLTPLHNTLLTISRQSRQVTHNRLRWPIGLFVLVPSHTTMHQPLAAPRLKDPESTSDTS